MGLLNVNDVATVMQLGTLDADSKNYWQFLLNSAEAAIQRLSSRRFARATYTDYSDSRDTDELLLRETPVASIVAIYEDKNRVFGPDTLVDPSKYQLKLDGYSNDSESGIVTRINGCWNLAGSWWGWPGLMGNVSLIARGPRNRLNKIPGCIKAVYLGGFAIIPYDLRTAIIQTVAYLDKSMPHGAAFKSDSHEGYSWSIATPDEELMRIGSVGSVVARYRRFVI